MPDHMFVSEKLAKQVIQARTNGIELTELVVTQEEFDSLRKEFEPMRNYSGLSTVDWVNKFLDIPIVVSEAAHG